MKLLTDQEARAMLKVSRTTLWRLRKSDGLPSLRVGGEIRYRESDLEAWLAQQDGVPTAEGSYQLDAPKNGQEAEWKRRVETEDWAFHSEPSDGLTHALHPYPAKFPPQIPEKAVEILARPGDRVLDPFCGCGTTLVEARKLGHPCVGVDANPVAVLASTAKTVRLGKEDLETLSRLRETTQRDAVMEAGEAPLLAMADEVREPTQPPPIPNLEKWFSKPVIRELGLLQSRIEELDSMRARTVARATLSAILVAVSNQDSETRYSSRDKGLSNGDVLSRFSRKLARVVRMHAEWAGVAGDSPATAVIGDARELPDGEVGRVDLVVTSPPYANAFDYHLYHRHRLYWLGYDPQALRSCEIGSHLNYQRGGTGVEAYVEDMTRCLASVGRCLRAGGPCFVVVGDSVFHGRTIDNAALLIEAARMTGYRCISVASRAIHPVSRSVIGPARRARIEKLLLFVRDE